jgi:tRNA A-37 threonylcarbamoyl transferase component Bud32
MSEPQHNAVRPDEVEVLLADCLAAPPGEVDTSVAAACEQHPEHAGELRRRLRSLRDLGVLSSFERGEEPPERIGRFRLLRRLGGGGMGVVHLALEEPLGREVALKLMRPEQLWFEGAHRRFLREAEAIASLAHPGIVSIHAFGEHDGLPFCAMEFIAGRSLGEILDGLRGRDPSTLRPGSIGQPGARNWTEACFSLALQVASALRHAHARAIVHRDVKPSNIMLDAEGRVRLIDFGLAHLARSESMTHTGTQPGSLAYMSPEQLRGESIDARTDIYSLGVTLYELLALRMPFRGNNEEQMRRAILDAATPRVDSINRGVARDAAAVVERAMAPEPSRRYPDMTALAADLSAFLEYRPVMARRAGPMLRAQRFVQRRPALATGLLLGFLLAAGLPSAWLLQERAARHAIEAEVQRAQRAELRSAREAEKAARVVAFLQELFDECEPASARGEQVTARTILDRGVQQIRDDLREESEIRTALLTTMGAAYLNLGLLDAARPLLDECAELLRNNPSTTPAERRQVLLLQAQLAGWNGENAEQEALLRAALATMPPPDSDPAAADVLSALGSSLWRQGRLDEGEALLRTAVDRLRQLERGQGIRLGRALQSLASYMQDRVDAASAAPLFAESTAVLRNALSESHPLRIGAAGNQALNLAELGRLPEAESLLREQLVIATRVFDAHHPRRGALEEQIAVVMLRRGNAVQAMHHLEAARRVYSATAHATNPLLARALNLESSIALEIEDLSRADRLAGESLAMYEALFPSGGFDFAMALGNLTRIRTALGRLPEAVQLGQRAVAMHEALAHRDVTAVALARSHLSHALALSGDHAAALATLPPAGPAPSTDRQLRIAAYPRRSAAARRPDR